MGVCFCQFPESADFCKARPALEPTILAGAAQASEPISFNVKRNVFSNCEEDEILKDQNGKPLFVVKGGIPTNVNRSVFTDCQGNLICVMMRKLVTTHHKFTHPALMKDCDSDEYKREVFYIYTPWPKFEGQHSEEITENETELYKFAMVCQDLNSRAKTSTVYAYSPSQDKCPWVPLYSVKRPKCGSERLMMRDVGEKDGHGVALLDEKKDEGWNLTVAAGVDPLLMFCSVMVMDLVKHKKRGRRFSVRRRFIGAGTIQKYPSYMR